MYATVTRSGRTSAAGTPMWRRFSDWFRGVRPRSPSRRSADPAVDLAGFLDDGERRDRQLIELREQAFGPDHPDVATALHILGARYHLVRRYQQAEALYDRVLSIRTETLGRDHPATIEVLEDLGDLWRDRADRYRAARAYDLALSTVIDPERRNRKRQDYNARLALLDTTP
jgi:tetratricopeptide (TPR) repeat protein